MNNEEKQQSKEQEPVLGTPVMEQTEIDPEI